MVSLAFDANCLDRIEPDLELYQKELLSDQRLKEDFQCLREALDYIKLRASGEEPGLYTTLEMERFLNKILFKEDLKTVAFFEDLMRIKSQFFGGSASSVSFDDFDNLKAYSMNIRNLWHNR